MKQYILNNLIAIDQLGNTLIGGYPDETISSRAYRADVGGRVAGKIFRPVIDWIFARLGDHDHCHKAFQSEVFRFQQSPKFRQMVD